MLPPGNLAAGGIESSSALKQSKTPRIDRFVPLLKRPLVLSYSDGSEIGFLCNELETLRRPTSPARLTYTGADTRTVRITASTVTSSGGSSTVLFPGSGFQLHAPITRGCQEAERRSPNQPSGHFTALLFCQAVARCAMSWNVRRRHIAPPIWRTARSVYSPRK